MDLGLEPITKAHILLQISLKIERDVPYEGVYTKSGVAGSH